MQCSQAILQNVHCIKNNSAASSKIITMTAMCSQVRRLFQWSLWIKIIVSLLLLLIKPTLEHRHSIQNSHFTLGSSLSTCHCDILKRSKVTYPGYTYSVTYKLLINLQWKFTESRQIIRVHFFKHFHFFFPYDLTFIFIESNSKISMENTYSFPIGALVKQKAGVPGTGMCSK